MNISRHYRQPLLVQRVLLRPSSTVGIYKGVDSFFAFDYMGAAEFEFGALKEALTSMRSRRGFYDKPRRIKDMEGNIIWYVGPQDQIDFAKAFFIDQHTGEKETDLKEPTFMKETIHEGKSVFQTIAWWSLNGNGIRIEQDLPWMLFRKKSHAKQWLKLL